MNLGLSIQIGNVNTLGADVGPDLTRVAYLNETSGDDIEAGLGNPTKPFASSAAALYALSQLSSGPTTISLQTDATSIDFSGYPNLPFYGCTIESYNASLKLVGVVIHPVGADMDMSLNNVRITLINLPANTTTSTLQYRGYNTASAVTVNADGLSGEPGNAGSSGLNETGANGDPGADGDPPTQGVDGESKDCSGQPGITGSSGNPAWDGILRGTMAISTLNARGGNGGQGGDGGAGGVATGGNGGKGGDSTASEQQDGAPGGAGGSATANGGDGAVGGNGARGGHWQLFDSASITTRNMDGGLGGASGNGGTRGTATKGSPGAGGLGIMGGSNGVPGADGFETATDGSQSGAGSDGEDGYVV